MDIQFILIQFIGFMACCFLIYSYYGKDTNHILIVQMISTVLFCIHYLLLGAYSGILICVYELIRDLLYYKTDLDDYVFMGSFIVYLISVLITFTSWLDIFPYGASLVDGYFLTKKKKVVLFGAIVTYASWLIYNLYVKSYALVITDVVIIVSNTYILLFKKEKKDMIMNKTSKSK